MLTRAVGAIALSFCLSSTAFAAHRPGLVQRVSCSVVRYYVAKYSARLRKYGRAAMERPKQRSRPPGVA